MTRKQIDQGHIRVALGHDDMTGFLISVYDTRLEVNEEFGSDFDDLRYAVAQDGTDAYISAYT